jgi:hypothetical protein
LELEDDPILREIVHTDSTPKEPHQQIGVEVLFPDAPRDPLVTPSPESLDDWTKPLTRRSEQVFVTAPPFEPTLDDPMSFERCEALAQHAPRYPGYPLEQIAEGAATAQELADDEGSPSFPEDFGSPSDRAELAVSTHIKSFLRTLQRFKFNF